MIAALLLRLLPFRAWLIGGAVALVLAYIGVLKVELWTAGHHLADERAARAVERTNALAAAVAATNQVRAIEASMQRQKDEAESERVRVQANNQRVIDSLAANLRGVRDELAAYAAGSREPSGDSLAACQRRAGALGDVLGEALRLQDELAGDAETEAANARGVLAAWPVTP